MLVFQIYQCRFEEPGPYAFEVLIDGIYSAATAFYVSLREPERERYDEVTGRFLVMIPKGRSLRNYVAGKVIERIDFLIAYQKEISDAADENP